MQLSNDSIREIIRDVQVRPRKKVKVLWCRMGSEPQETEPMDKAVALEILDELNRYDIACGLKEVK